eukprot:8688887-Lingulodinium_polyedra.AAC.1
MITDINRNTEFKCRVSGLLLDNNSVDEHAVFLAGTADVDLDCCLIGVLNWGRNEQAQPCRGALQDQFFPDDLLA